MNKNSQYTASESDSRVAAIADDAWAHLLKSDQSATLGIDSPLEQMQITLAAEPIPTLTFEAAQKRSAFARGILERLGAVPVDSLGEDARITHGVLSNRYRYLADEARYYWVDFDIVPYKANRPLTLMTDTLRANDLSSTERRECYVQLLHRFGQVFDQQKIKLEEQAARGIRLPRQAINGTRSMYEGIALTVPELLIDEQRRTRSGSNPSFAVEVEKIVRDTVSSAVRKLIDALGPQYECEAPEAVGLGQYPDGSDQYRRLIEAYTTLRLDPEALQRTGFERVRQISEEILEKAARIGLDGDLQTVFDVLRADARFKARSAEEITSLYVADIAAVAPRLGDCFSSFPQSPYAAERLAPAAEKVLTYGGYFPPSSTESRGIYFFNASGLESRTMLTHRALIYHELVPGHHFQLARQQENGTLHPMRRRYAPAGFIEGWAEYAAGLGYEMGLYTDPYDDLGRKVMELFLAMRLVVDPGLAELGWSLQQARDYMRQTIFQSAAEIESESLRYAIGPAQALCYGVGHGAIQELRSRVERAAESQFDLRRFHECVLNAGSMPLDVLQWRVERHFGLEPHRI